MTLLIGGPVDISQVVSRTELQSSIDTLNANLATRALTTDGRFTNARKGLVHSNGANRAVLAVNSNAQQNVFDFGFTAAYDGFASVDVEWSAYYSGGSGVGVGVQVRTTLQLTDADGTNVLATAGTDRWYTPVNLGANSYALRANPLFSVVLAGAALVAGTTYRVRCLVARDANTTVGQANIDRWNCRVTECDWAPN